MGIWLFLLFLLLVILINLLILVMASTITIRLHLVLRGLEYRMKVDGKLLYGLVNLNYEKSLRITDTGIQRTDTTLSKQTKKMSETLDEKMKLDKDFHFRDILRVLRATDNMKEWFLKTMSIVSVSESRWKTYIALDNAAETAVAAGMVWGIKHTVLGLMSFYLKLTEPPQLQVHPEFNSPPQLSSEMNVEIQINFGRFLLAGLGLIIRVLKVKGGLKTWRQILFRTRKEQLNNEDD